MALAKLNSLHGWLSSFLASVPDIWLMDAYENDRYVSGHRVLSVILARRVLDTAPLELSQIAEIWDHMKASDYSWLSHTIPELFEIMSRVNARGIITSCFASNDVLISQLVCNCYAFPSAMRLHQAAVALSNLLAIQDEQIYIRDLSCSLGPPISESFTLSIGNEPGMSCGFKLHVTIYNDLITLTATTRPRRWTCCALGRLRS